MRKISYILIILLLFLTSCYTSFKEINRNGISKLKETYSLFPIRKSPRGSYASDQKFVKGVDLAFFNDTINKRCFNSYELEGLKKFLLQDTLFKKNTFGIFYSTKTDSRECIGLFYVGPHYVINGSYTRFPIIKLQDTIYINGLLGIKIDEQTQKYISTKLLEVYDSVETKWRMDAFMKGKYYESANKGSPPPGGFYER